VVANRGVDNESGPTVTLKGEMISLGGEAPHVYICWGQWEGNQGTGSWQYVIDKGVQSGAFSNDVSTEAGSNYFYTCFATNSGGGAWASPNLPFGAATIRYVDSAATGGNTGYNWSNAYPSLATALAECRNDRTNVIYLRGGVHPSALPFQLTNSHVLVRGGYQGLGTPGARDTTQWPSIVTNNSSANRVLFVGNVSNVTIEGLTLTGGRPAGGAAGLYATNVSAVTVRECVIENNITLSGNSGGGIYLLDSTNVTFDACTVRGNRAYTYGAGAYVQGSGVLFTNCLISGNILNSPDNTTAYGAGVLANGGNVRLRDCVLELQSSVLGYNANVRGGGFCSLSGTHTIENCLARYNDATYGDGIYVNGGAVRLLNCTVFRNKGYGVHQAGGACGVTNSILWANYDDVAGTVNLGYCDVQDGDSAGANGCIAADPRFEHLYGLYLGSDSPCTNAGDRSASSAGLAGRTTRVDGTLDADTVDLGYHYAAGGNAALANYGDLYVATNGSDVANSGTNAASPFRTVTKALTIAGGGNRIHIGAGTYSTNAGEVFPLILADTAGISFLGTNAPTTVVDAGSGTKRVFQFVDTAAVTLEGLTVRGGRPFIGAASSYGGGIYAEYAADLSVHACILTGNRTQGDNWGQGYGGGLYLYASTLTMQDTIVSNNVSAGDYGHGGGLYQNWGRSVLRRCVIANNVAAGQYPDYRAYGGGIKVEAGSLYATNCLIVRNRQSGGTSVKQGIGVYSGDTLVLANCTVADNEVEGVRCAGGTVEIRNSILWSNNMADVTGGVFLAYCDVQDGTSNGVHGCISVDPLFFDRMYYHLCSRGGCYMDGYFSGGSWTKSLVSSPAIDAGDPTSPYAAEPFPNGVRVNLGAYGNTDVASLKGNAGTTIIIQ
jgi:parallel beta-helix repeat protein